MLSYLTCQCFGYVAIPIQTLRTRQSERQEDWFPLQPVISSPTSGPRKKSHSFLGPRTGTTDNNPSAEKSTEQPHEEKDSANDTGMIRLRIRYTVWSSVFQ